jgi:hypothetical protein
MSAALHFAFFAKCKILFLFFSTENRTFQESSLRAAGMERTHFRPCMESLIFPPPDQNGLNYLEKVRS